MTDDGTFKYYYDCENRLTDVNDANDSPVVSYKYDFAGRRVRKIDYTLNPVRYTLYCYDGDQVIAEFNGSNYGLRRFFYGPGIDEPVAMRSFVNGGVEGTFYYHYDGLGNVVAISNTDGNVVEIYEYDVYGQPTIWDMNSQQMVEKSTVGNPYLFTGRRFDDEAGNYYYRARYYSPDIGRFLQTDPIGYAAGLNLYIYCENNPLNWIDPYGDLTLPWTDKHRNRNRHNRPPPTRKQAEKSPPWKKEKGNIFHPNRDTYRGHGPFKGSQASYYPNDPEKYGDKAGKLDDETKERGTKDHTPPSESKLGHFLDDVLPHIFDQDYKAPSTPTDPAESDDGKKGSET